MQVMSGLRYLDRPLTYGNTSTTSTALSNQNTDSTNIVNSDEQDYHMNTCINNNSAGHRVGAMNHAYKANKKLTIIHYDLKPANILFDEMGDVKITGTYYIYRSFSSGSSSAVVFWATGYNNYILEVACIIFCL